MMMQDNEKEKNIWGGDFDHNGHKFVVIVAIVMNIIVTSTIVIKIYLGVNYLLCKQHE